MTQMLPITEKWRKMLTDEEIADIHTIFKIKGYTWSVGGKSVNPNFEQIKDMVSKLFEALDDEEPGTSISSGRITVHKDCTYYDVFVQMGEVKIESS